MYCDVCKCQLPWHFTWFYHVSNTNTLELDWSQSKAFLVRRYISLTAVGHPTETLRVRFRTVSLTCSLHGVQCWFVAGSGNFVAENGNKLLPETATKLPFSCRFRQQFVAVFGLVWTGLKHSLLSVDVDVCMRAEPCSSIHDHLGTWGRPLGYTSVQNDFGALTLPTQACCSPRSPCSYTHMQ